MSRVYIAPIGSDWTDEFARTVASPVSLPDSRPQSVAELDSTRLWGTSASDRKHTQFQEMESGDPLLFYSDGEFFASGRVGETIHSAQLGKDIWGSDDSELLYTVEDYEEHSIETQTVADLLNYDDGWFPRGFMQVSQAAVNAILTEYSSVEEAFQDLRASQTNGDADPPWLRERETDEGDPEQTHRTHTEIQWRLIQLGLTYGYDVHVAINDQSQEYDGEKLGEDCVEALVLPGISESVTRIIEYIDVVWLEDDAIVAMFEVESTTSIYSGILRMTDFATRVPNIAVDMYIIAAANREDQVRQQMGRPTFESVLDPVEYSSLQYVSFEEVRTTHDTVKNAGPLQEVF